MFSTPGYGSGQLQIKIYINISVCILELPRDLIIRQLFAKTMAEKMDLICISES